MPDLKSFFSYKGRLGRLQYFLRQGAICIIFSLLGYSLDPPLKECLFPPLCRISLSHYL